MTINPPSDIERYGRKLPPHPSTYRRCRVCRARYSGPPDREYTLCPLCLERPDLLEHIDAQIAATLAARDVEHERWLAQQAGLEDELSKRWAALVAARNAARTKVERLLRGPRRSGQVTPAGALEAARAALEAVQRKIERTRRADDDIADLLKAERAHEQTLERLWDTLARWEMARSDLELALGREL